MKIPKAWIFDLDGVIVETIPYHYKSWKKLADTLEIPFGEAENESLKGLSRRQSLQKILALDNRSVPEEKFQQLMRQKNEWYLNYISDLDSGDILEGITGFLEQLKTLNVKLAIGSSSQNARRIVNHLQLNSFFETIIDGKQVKKAKPDPEIFLKGAEVLQVHPQDCLVFEDASSGIRAAKEAGMLCVGVGTADYLAEADLTITSFEKQTPKNLLMRLYH